MKRIVALLLALMMALSVYIPIQSSPIRFTNADRELYYVDIYHEHIWDNFNNLFDFTPWGFLTDSRLFAYQGFVQNINNDSFLTTALPAAFWVTNESPTVERYVEILVNLILLMEHDLSEVHNQMAEADALKTTWDYAYDTLSIVAGIRGGRFGSLAFSTGDMIIDNVNSHRFLAKMLLDYETSRNFLDVIIRYADNENLIQGARVLRNTVDRVAQHQLDNFNEMVGRFGRYMAQDVFLDVIILEMIADPSHLALDVVDQFALEKLAEGYTFLKAVGVARGAGVLIADVIAGISNVFNRVVEMQAMYDINHALIRSTNGLRRSIQSGEELDEIERVIQNMRYMLYVNARGDYLLYQMAIRDGRLLSFVATDRQGVRDWYARVPGQLALLANPLDWFWPEREWFRIYADDYLETPSASNLYHEAREAFYEFLRQRAFQPYADVFGGWEYPVNMYAIMDIDGDGIPELIVSSVDSFLFSIDWIFSYDPVQRRVIHLANNFRFGSLSYSQQHLSFVYREGRASNIINFVTLDDLKNGVISTFTLFSDYSGHSVHYGDFWDDVPYRRITEEERQRFFDDVVDVEFLEIFPSEQVEIGVLHDWQGWFRISFGEWFRDSTPELIQSVTGFEMYRHPLYTGGVLTFNERAGTNDYPIIILMPISRLLGRPSTSVAELRNIFGESFDVFYDAIFIGDGWAGFANMDGHHMTFFLESEHDTNITWVEIQTIWSAR